MAVSGLTLSQGISSDGSGFVVLLNELPQNLNDDNTFNIQINDNLPRGTDVPESQGAIAFEWYYDYLRQEYTITYFFELVNGSASMTFGPFTSASKAAESQLTVAVKNLAGAGPVTATLDRVVIIGEPDVAGDSSGNDVLDVNDVDFLINGIRNEYEFVDLTNDGIADAFDLEYWVHDLKSTFYGDANLNGQFSSSDLVIALQGGEYEDDIPRNSTWSSGDWNGDGDFTTADLVLAFQDGGYELGPREAVRSVPEPNESRAAVSFAVLLVWLVRRRRFVA
ncbi:MAG: hypothetical protein R3C28_03465 [Pirellulaceae bacterium]